MVREEKEGSKRRKEERRSEILRERQSMKMISRLKRKPETMRRMNPEEYRNHGFWGGEAIEAKKGKKREAKPAIEHGSAASFSLDCKRTAGVPPRIPKPEERSAPGVTEEAIEKGLVCPVEPVLPKSAGEKPKKEKNGEIGPNRKKIGILGENVEGGSQEANHKSFPMDSEPETKEILFEKKSDLPGQEAKETVTIRKLKKSAAKARKAKRRKKKSQSDAKPEVRKEPKEKAEKKLKGAEADYRRREDDVLFVPPLPFSKTAEYIPIKAIQSGIVETTGGEFIKILEIFPINFHLRPVHEQNKIIEDYIHFQAIAPVSFQIKVISRKADVERFLHHAHLDIYREQSERCKKLQQASTDFFAEIGGKESVSHRFFLVIQYTGRKAVSDREIRNVLQSTALDIENYLHRCGNPVRGVDFKTRDVLEILYFIFNRSDHPGKELQERMNEVKAYYLDSYGEKSLDFIPVTDLFAPRKLAFQDFRYVKVDDTFYTYLYVSSKGYPKNVTGGWVDFLTGVEKEVDVDFFFRRENREIVDARIGRHLRFNIMGMKDLNATTKEFNNLSEYIEAGFFLRDGLARGEELYQCVVLLTIRASSEKEVLQKARDVQKALLFHKIKAEQLYFKEEMAYQATMPINKIPNPIYQKAHRNMLTSGVGSMYPYTAFELNDPNGISLGLNLLNSSLVITDFFDTQKYPNANAIILGRSGMGKSYLLQICALRFRYQQKQVFLIAPEKGFEFLRSCEGVDGLFLSMLPSSNICINPLEIRPRDTRVNESIDGVSQNQSELIQKVEWLQDLLSVWIRDMTGEEANLLSVALMEVYRRKGITKENDSLWNVDHTSYKEMPLFSDLYEVLMEKTETRRLATYLLRLIDGSAANFNAHTNINLENLFIVFDISSLKGDLLLFAMLIVLDLVYSKVKEDRTVEKCVFLDEVWKLIGMGADARVANYVVELFKLIRSYGGAAVAATQDISDYLGLQKSGSSGVSYGELIINACAVKFVLGLEPREARRVAGILDLSEAETSQIINFDRGKGLVCTLNSHIPVRFLACKEEHDRITTDHRELLEKYRKGDFSWKNH